LVGFAPVLFPLLAFKPKRWGINVSAALFAPEFVPLPVFPHPFMGIIVRPFMKICCHFFSRLAGFIA
jgi:hypothetical protein